ncbi:MAG: hypothetical protein IJA44_01265 [Clostridia bacterium]|nr:hypothetical protein [Clostridia bacterium]
MNNSKPFAHHFIWLSTLFILGSSIINLPFKNADKLTFLGFLIAFLLSIALIFAVYKFDFLKYPIMFLAIYFVGEALIVFLQFISQTLLNNNQNFWVLLLFLATLIYFCFRKATEIFNFSLVCGVVCGLLLVFFFFSTLKDFNPENIYIYSFPKINNLFSQALPYIKSVTLPTAVLTLYAKQTNTTKTVAFSGICVGNAFLLISIFNSVLLFGAQMAGEFDYPYAMAISTVTFGNLFSRLDGFSYFIYFVTALIKITVCINVIKQEINVRAN